VIIPVCSSWFVFHASIFRKKLTAIRVVKPQSLTDTIVLLPHLRNNHSDLEEE